MCAPDATVDELERALVFCADALARLMTTERARWRALCREEAREITTLMQYYAAVGVAPELVPQLTIGARIVTLLSERHPQLCTDDATTTG
jgi:hypothetical protein